MVDTRNVINKYKDWGEDLIREEIAKESLPFAVCMTQLTGDFNFSNIVRSANALGANEIFYIGKKKWDRRGAVGTYIYSQPIYYPTWEDFYKDQHKNYLLIALEQSENSTPINEFVWQKYSCIIVGEENAGLSESILEACDAIVEIPQRGSVRSLNAASAAAIAMYDYIATRE